MAFSCGVFKTSGLSQVDALVMVLYQYTRVLSEISDEAISSGTGKHTPSGLLATPFRRELLKSFAEAEKERRRPIWSKTIFVPFRQLDPTRFCALFALAETLFDSQELGSNQLAYSVLLPSPFEPNLNPAPLSASLLASWP
jgi:hypothetical protein